MTRYTYNAQVRPPAPFVRLTLRHPHTGADQTVTPAAFADHLGLHQSGSERVFVAGGSRVEMALVDVLLGVHDHPPQRLEVLAHPDEPWVLLGRDVLNHFRVVLDGPRLALEIG